MERTDFSMQTPRSKQVVVDNMPRRQQQQQQTAQCLMCTTKSTVRRKQQQRRTRTSTIPRLGTIPTLLFLQSFLFLLFLSSSAAPFANAAAWTGGPEDTFFCGYKWDDEPCSHRQHCPTGQHEECEGSEDGVKCFAYSNCDVKFGHGDGFVSGKPPKQSPGGTPNPTYTGVSEDKTDHYFCGVGLDDAKVNCVQHCPGGVSSECPQGHICYHDVITCDARNIFTFPPTAALTSDESKIPTKPPMSGPTKIPTEMPIPPPEPLPFPSDDPSDHWFCGIGIDDANSKCAVHCPTANECPIGQICYFGTMCDGRTFEPTPPPTRRPTTPPTRYPTGAPTDTMPPSMSPSMTVGPTASPTEQIPTRSPTQSPTKRPTFAPMPTLQSSFFCGKTWNDVITNCPKKCPSGEDPECPEGEFCFAYTGCTEEKGYLDGEGGDADGEGIANPDMCVPFEVTIVADNWPKENSWTLTNEAGDIVKEGINDNLVTGEPANWHECISKKVCYEFTIHDTGGDGICCDHGGGSYEVKFDGKVVKNGAAFYEFESTEVGRCGDTIAPTEAPKEAAKPSGGGGGGGNSGGGPSYRCVATQLVQSGYKVASDKCDSFTSCFNQFINDGDDWFCDENAQCIEAPACGTNEDDSAIDDPAPPAVAGVSYRCVAAPLVESGYKISSDKCDLFDDCYNKDTNDGDAFFCDDIAQCIEAPACIVEKKTPAISSVPPPSNAVTANPPAASEDSTTEGAKPPAISDSNIESAKPPATSASTDNSVVDASPGKRPIASKPSAGTKPVPNKASIEDMPTLSPTSNSTTLLPTFSPTNGPCGGAKCNRDGHCRSQYGFCGPGETYCNEKATWTPECPTFEPTPGPSLPIQTDSPTYSTFVIKTPTSLKVTSPPSVDGGDNTFYQTTAPPTAPPYPLFKKPGGKGKPSGGSRPAMTHPPTTPFPTRRSANINSVVATFSPTKIDTNTPTNTPTTSPESFDIDIGNFLENPPPTRSPTPEPTQYLTQKPTTVPTIEVQSLPWSEATTSSPTKRVSSSSDTDSDSDGIACTGDPCPIESHCRSRYGSCGPGFIYCNVYTIWESSCPPRKPGTTPTRSPSPKPTKSPSSVDNQPTEVEESVPTLPTFRPLPQPTLALISDPKPAGPISPKKDLDPPISESDSAQNKPKDEKKEEFEAPEASTNTFQSAQYLDTWSMTSSTKDAHRSTTFSSLIVSLSIIFRIISS